MINMMINILMVAMMTWSTSNGFPSGSSVEIGTTRSRLAWPARKDGTRESRSVNIGRQYL